MTTNRHTEAAFETVIEAHLGIPGPIGRAAKETSC